MTGRKIRYKKLSVKTPLPVLREDQIDPGEYESLTAEGNIATGVEAAEENEYHLQAVLRGAGVATDKEIPVPPPEESSLNYDELYPQQFSKTCTYIRFSQTVEECIGCRYDMTEEDEAFLKSYNLKTAPSAQLLDDDFEKIMEVFEDTAYQRAPFAAVDQTIVPYDEMLHGLHELDKNKVMPHAKDIYEHWKARRLAVSNRSLHPTLKFEMHQESDEMDPYVCFRRREVRQTRKTRARDVQSAEKLKRMRKELEEGRQLVLASHNRELLKAEMLKTDRAIFEQRAQLKEHKIRLGIKTDDDDLINQKPQKRKAADISIAQRPPPPSQLRMPVRPSGQPAEAELVQLADKLVEKENELLADIEKKVQNHNEWNKRHVDLTRGPLSPVHGPRPDLSFRPAKTQYLMTPPASASSASMEEPTPMELDKPADPQPVFKFRGVSQDQSAMDNAPQYRRRIGRLNRLWIDRRGLASPPRDLSERQTDQWKYDNSSDDEEDTPMYEVDPFDTLALKFRASIPLPPWMNLRAPSAGGRPVQAHPVLVQQAAAAAAAAAVAVAAASPVKQPQPQLQHQAVAQPRGQPVP